jgi:hypothetical protein
MKALRLDVGPPEEDGLEETFSDEPFVLVPTTDQKVRGSSPFGRAKDQGRD